MNAYNGFGQTTIHTVDFGDLELGRSFVRRRWEPRDENTWETLSELVLVLGMSPKRPSDLQKLIRCLSDVIQAALNTPDGLVCWPTGSGDMYGPPYSRDVAVQVKMSLEKAGKLKLVQKSSKHDKVARLYRIDKDFFPKGLKFRKHRDHSPVEVRSEKKRINGKLVGGTPLSRKKFLGQIEPIEEKMYRINDFMEQHPLQAIDGKDFSDCRRIFNNGDLSHGGRLYGDWQGMNEGERLTLLIDGERVCEIDIKACFLCLVYGKFGSGQGVSDDPYSDIPFVKNCNDPDRKKVLRTVAKLLVVAYLGKQGDLKRFPKGVKEKVEEKAVPFRVRYGLNHKADYYMDQILETHPVLELQKKYGDDLMLLESNTIVEVMENLIALGVPSYPVHDCIIVPLSKMETALKVLSTTLENRLGFVPALDVAYYDDKGEKVEILIPGSQSSGQRPLPQNGQSHHSKTTSLTGWTLEEDYILLE